MDDLQRIVGQPHVQQGEVPPRAADGVERLGRQTVGEPRQAPRHALTRLLRIERLAVGQGERPQGQGGALSGTAILDADQLQAEAAEIAGHAGRPGNAGRDAEGRQPGLLFALQHLHRQPGLGLDLADEVLAVLGLADRRRRRDEHRRWLQLLQHGLETPERGVRRLHSVDGQPAGGWQVPAEPGEHLFVEHGPDRPPLDPIQDQADGIGADVDDRRVARRPIFAVPHGRSRGAGPWPSGRGRTGWDWS